MNKIIHLTYKYNCDIMLMWEFMGAPCVTLSRPPYEVRPFHLATVFGVEAARRMDPDAPWQRSQEAAARKAVETTDAAWPTMVAGVLWRRRQKVIVRIA